MAWYYANHERALAAHARWRNANKERVKERKKTWKTSWGPIEWSRARRRWYLKHRDERLEYARRYRREHPHKVRLALFRYRARFRSANGDATDEKIAARVAFFGGVCAYCGGPFEHLDHAIAISRGGTNWPANLRPSCRRCNQMKNDKSVVEFIAWRKAIGIPVGDLTVILPCGTL